MSNVFERLESEVRSYSRAFPAVFHRAAGSRVWSRDGASYLDFFSGAGAAKADTKPGAAKKAGPRGAAGGKPGGPSSFHGRRKR